jgi:predicted branched-subunit amino acid permease
VAPEVRASTIGAPFEGALVPAGKQQMVSALRPVAALRARLLPPMSMDGFRAGVKDVAGVTVGIVIWGVVTGVAMVRAGVPLGWAITIGLVAYAGSAQLAVLPLIVTRTPIPIVFLTATLVNLRFVIFSAAMRHEFAHLSLWQRYVSAYVNGDFAFTLSHRRFAGSTQSTNPDRLGYFWGVAIVNLVAWHASSTIGMLLGNGLPNSWGLDLAATLALISVMIPMVAQSPVTRSIADFLRRPIVMGVAMTAVASVASARLPYRLGLVASILLGIAAALFAERLWTPGCA